MNKFLSSLFIMFVFSLSACSGVDASPSANSPAPLAYAVELAKVAGIKTGNQSAAKTVYIFFDMQCPHCGHMWDSTKQSSDVKIVWVPVGFLSQTSLTQGAILLNSPTPHDLMEEHEASLLAKKGGVTTVGVQLAEHAKAKMNANTQAFKALNLSSVPFAIMKTDSGKFVTGEGAMSPEQFKAFTAQ